MKNVNDLNSFLNEKKVTVKRRYTEAYPAKNVSTAARVRSSILEAIADGHITEEEMTRILSELKAHKRWLSRNKGLFNISEDQAGIKTFSLSPYGLRVKNKTTVLNEALNVPHKEKGKKPVNMFVGRFQPFTLGHVKVFEKMYKENGLPVVVYMVRGGKPDPEKRPFDEDMQQAMFAKMKKQYPFLEASFVVPNGAIDTMFAAARPAYEPMMWGYGTDRKKDYGGMINKQSYRDDLGVDPSFKGYEIPRTGENISASKVRNALKIDDEKSFKKMTPKSIHSFYKTLQNTLQPIKENNNMKNLKSFSSFGINEAKFNKKSLMKAMKKDDDYENGWYESVMTEAMSVNEWGSSDQGNFNKSMHKEMGSPKKMPSPFDDKLRGVAADNVDHYWDDWDEYQNDRDGLIDDAVRSYLRSFFKKDFEMLTKMFASNNITEKTYNKKSLMKAMKKDDGMIQLGNGQEYVIYNPNNGNDDNTDMWKDKVIFGLDQDGGEHEIEYSDIVSYNESVINEEYIELMQIDKPLEDLKAAWEDWKSGPGTNYDDVPPAFKELQKYVTKWLKKNLR